MVFVQVRFSGKSDCLPQFRVLVSLSLLTNVDSEKCMTVFYNQPCKPSIAKWNVQYSLFPKKEEKKTLVKVVTV